LIWPPYHYVSCINYKILHVMSLILNFLQPASKYFSECFVFKY
jgi:hypothetical protein